MTPQKWEGMKRMLREIQEKNWLGELAQRCTAGAWKLVDDEYRKQQDPYGNAWAPLQRERTRDRRARLRAVRAGRKPRGMRILQRTGRMRAGTGATATGHLLRVSVPVDYSLYHQRGTFKMDRRAILPDVEGGGNPETWDNMIRKEAALLLAQKMGAK
jgi:hypothetical protein